MWRDHKASTSMITSNKNTRDSGTLTESITKAKFHEREFIPASGISHSNRIPAEVIRGLECFI